MPHLKGEDLLRKCMEQVGAAAPGKAELLVFGQNQPANTGEWPCPVHWLGPVRDDHTLAMLYSAANVTVVPSRQDNLPNTAIESHACGTPVVAFTIGGLPDIVTPGETGWLASPFDTDDLAHGVMWVLGDAARWSALSRAARASAMAKYSPQAIAAQYLSVYEGVCARR